MVAPRSREGDGSVGLRVERVDLVPTDLGTVIVRVAGRWTGDPLPAAPVLHAGDRTFEAMAASSSAAERAAPDASAFRATFSVPEELRPSLLGALRLALGDVEVALPVAHEIAGEASGGPATVIDRAVLAERRARRAELAEEEVARRAEQAEGSVAALEGELAKLELRLERASGERAELQARVADAVREARAAAQRAHAERRRREEAVDEAADRIDEAEHEAARLRARLDATEERARSLTREVDELRRRIAEAEHAAAAAESARRRAEEQARHEVHAAQQRADEETRIARASPGASRHAALRAEAALAASLAGRRIAPPASAVPAAVPALGRLLGAERRLVAARRAEAGPADLREEARRAAAAVAEAAWSLAEARDAVGGATGGVEAANAELARAHAERDALLAERERLAEARAAAESEARRLRHELSRRAQDRAGAERAIAQLGARIEELQATAAQARRGAEAEAAARELAASAGEALAEAERRIAQAHSAAVEAQDSLERERADHERAETELRAAFEEERRRLELRVEEAATLARADLEARVAALEAALADERASVRSSPPMSRPGPRTSTKRPTPVAPSPVSPAPRPSRPVPAAPAGPRSAWLPVALERLAAEHPQDAARLGVQLLPAQALPAGAAVDYDLRVDGIGWHAVTLREGRGTVAPLERHRARRASDFRLDVDAPALVALLSAGGSPGLRRAGQFKVRGTLRRRRAARSIPAADLDLARLAEAGVWPDPGLVMRALATLVEPSWTRGHGFAVGLDVLGPRGGRWRVRAADGAPLEVRAAVGQDEPVDATVRITQPAYQRLLAGRPGPGDRGTTIAGHVTAVSALMEWIERAQRSA